MSWQAYIDDSLVASGHIDKAAIISVAGDSAWASSADFTVDLKQMKVLADILNNTGRAQDDAQANGFHIGADRFVLTKIDGSSLYARQGRTGIAARKTKQAILVAHHGEAQQAGNATQTVEALGDYLEGQGY